MTACLNAANERANELFRGEKLGYLGIPKSIEVCEMIHVIIIHPICVELFIISKSRLY